jgi:hypothetical protein
MHAEFWCGKNLEGDRLEDGEASTRKDNIKMDVRVIGFGWS